MRSVDSRGVSDLIGYILVFALIFATVGFVSLTGLPTLDSARESEQLQNAGRAFDVLDSNLVEVYARGAPSRATEISADDGTVGTAETVTFTVTVEDTDGNTTAAVAEINPVVFSGLGRTQFVYEAGAVIREQQEASIMLRDPPMKLDDDRLFFTLVETFSDSRQSSSGGTVLVRASSTGGSVEITDAAVGNSAYEQVNVTVAGSSRQDVWQRYFEEDLGMSCNAGPPLDCGSELDGVEQTFVTVQAIEIDIEN